jgi:hypothetical protein
MLIVCESTPDYKSTKPAICPKCKRGVIGHIPEGSETVISRRGRPPPANHGDYVQVKCFVCRSHWMLIHEN